VFSEELEQLEKTVPDSIDGAIEQRDGLAYDSRRRSLFPDFYYKLREKRYDWYQKHGFELSVAYDALVQGYNDRDRSVGGASGDLSLHGRWLLFGEKFNRPMYLFFRFRDRRAYSEYAPSEIQRETDLLWGTVHGFNNSGFQVPDFYFEHQLFDGDLALRYGQFSIRKFVDTHSLRGAKRFFLNEAFSDNPTVNFPSFGAGFSAKWRPVKRWEIAGGASNIQGVEGEHYVDFSLDSKALFGAMQVAYNFKGIGQRDGRIQIMGWGSEDNDEKKYAEGNGVSLTFQHGGLAKGENYALRYAQSSGDSKNTDIIMFLGYSKEIRGFDNFGLGVGRGDHPLKPVGRRFSKRFIAGRLPKSF